MGANLRHFSSIPYNHVLLILVYKKVFFKLRETGNSTVIYKISETTQNPVLKIKSC